MKTLKTNIICEFKKNFKKNFQSKIVQNKKNYFLISAIAILLLVMLLVAANKVWMVSQKNNTSKKLETDVSVSSFDSLKLSTKKSNKDNSSSKYINIKYYLGRGNNSLLNYRKIKREDCPYKLKNPICSNYIFDGWYTDPNFKNKTDRITANMNNNITLYAKWTQLVNNKENVENFPYKSSIYDDSSKKWLKYCDYSFLDLNIPGMPSTRGDDFLNKYIFSKTQTPQGICITEDYILITSYAQEKNTEGALFVFDKNTQEYLVTLGMDPKSHLGGIAYDGENVWVCNSHMMTIERISYDFIKLMATQNRGKTIDASQVVDCYKVVNVPSSITYHSGRLWIVTHNIFFKAKLVAYHYTGDKLLNLSEFSIPSKAQGISFLDSGRVCLSTSYGRTASSHLKVYKSVPIMAAEPNSPEIDIEMPPGSESIDADEKDNVYVLFESASKKYIDGTDGYGQSLCPIDKILKVKIEN